MNLRKYIISNDANIIDALKKINENSKGIVFVCDQNEKLIGTITDGDIRRHIINNGNATDNVTYAMKTNPIIADYSIETTKDIYKKIHQKKLKAIPLLDESGVIVDIFFEGEEKHIKRYIDIPVVIMAGGKGIRLKPYTDVLPKPLIPVGGRTIIDRIIRNFKDNGCKNIFVIINYKKELIKAYFISQSSMDNLKLIEENEFLGTAGGLSLLKDDLKETFIVSNCDILIEDEYYKFYEKHKSDKNLITIIAIKKDEIIPYGVLKVDDQGKVTGIDEKPKRQYIMNSGFYIIEPEALQLIPDNKFIHMTDIIEICRKKGYRIGTYLINESQWLDMGQKDELKKMMEFFE